MYERRSDKVSKVNLFAVKWKRLKSINEELSDSISEFDLLSVALSDMENINNGGNEVTLIDLGR